MAPIIKTLIVGFAAIMSFITVQTVQADEFTVAGVITQVDRSLSTIVVGPDDVTIIGFPFHNLEIQLDEILKPLNPDEDGITIDVGDCVTIVYDEKELASGEVVDKWVSLTEYCEACAEVPELCFMDDGVLTREPGKNRPKPPPLTGSGKRRNKPPGQKRP